MVLIDSSTIMIIAGFQGAHQGNKTLIHSFTKEKLPWAWTFGPEIKTARCGHACSIISSGQGSNAQSVIIAGDSNEASEPLSSVEILDIGSNSWREGPELRSPIAGASMVKHPNGGVILIGGSNKGTYLDTLYHLPHAGPGAEWQQMQQRLKTGRDYHAVALVPDEIVEHCSNNGK